MRMNHAFTPARRMPPPITFICSGCDCVEHRRTDALPQGWTTQQVCDDIHAYCADCSEGVEPAVLAAQLRRDNIAFAAMLPALLGVGLTAWTMFPA